MSRRPARLTYLRGRATRDSGLGMIARGLRTLYVGGDHCISLHDNVLLLVAKNDPEPSFTSLLPTIVRRLKAEAAGPVGFLVVVTADAPPPADEARARLRAAFDTFNASMAFGALVVERTGFVGASMRSVVNVLVLASRPTYPMKVFGSIDDAARWVVQTQGEAEGRSAPALAQLVESLKTDYRAGTLRETR